MIRISRHCRATLEELLKGKYPQWISFLYAECDITRDDAREIWRAVEKELLAKGFDKSSEPTRYGISLEWIMDEIHRNYLCDSKDDWDDEENM